MPRDADAARIERILVGVDGSRRAQAAAEFAGRLAAVCGARLIVASVYVLRPLSGTLESGEEAAALAREAAARAARGPFECRIAPSTSPAEGLRAIATSDAVDLVVLGSRHRGRLGETLGGGVARRLLRGAAFPVVLVPPSARSAGDRSIGVLQGSRAETERAVAVAQALAAGGDRVRLYGGPGRTRSLSDDLDAGRVDVLVVPAWPHGLAGRLHGHATRTQTAACAVVIVPPGARIGSLPAAASTAP